MHCLLQEFCNGGTLRSAVSAGVFHSSKLPRRWAPIIGILKDIAAGMHYMHGMRICQGDLSPATVLLRVRLPCMLATHGILQAERRQHACRQCMACCGERAASAQAQVGRRRWHAKVQGGLCGAV
jgi:serine/threonine protein kinase